MIREMRPGDPGQVGPYCLLGRLGTGGMGQVFLGRSAGGRPVAVKVIRPELAEEPGFRARFAREVAAAKDVNGLYTAVVVGADTQGPEPWLATAYVAGPSLAEAVEERGALPAASVLALAAGLAEGLAAIHAAGVVHRDLKPSNVLLADDGPRIIDFGISRAADVSMLTQSGAVIGSPGFMSPEQAEGSTVGPASDVFSLGSVLAFAATGEGPFGTGSTPALIYRVVHRPPDILKVPREIRPLVERCLAKDPGERPTPARLLAALGAGALAADWLPDPVTEGFCRYAPPAPSAVGASGDALPADPAASPMPLAAFSGGPPTQTSAPLRRTPTEVAVQVLPGGEPDSPRPGDQPVHPRHWSRRRLARAAAVACALAVASALVAGTGGSAGAPRRSEAASSSGGTAFALAPSFRSRPAPADTAVPVKRAHVAKGRRKTVVTASRQVPGASSGSPAGGPQAQSAQPPPQSAQPPPQPGPSGAGVPDVLGMRLPAAASALKVRGFENIPYLYGCYGSQGIDDVVRQDPGSEAQIARTAPVQLYLQADNCRTVPNVIGMSLSSAAYTLKGADFTNIPYVYGCYGSARIGSVVNQSPAAGASYGDTQPVALKLQADNC